MERKVNKKVEAAGEELADLIKDLTAARLAKNDGESKLIHTMQEEKVSRYKHEEAGIEIILSSKDKVRLKKIKKTTEDDESVRKPKAKA
jgi:hypothetical protein